MDHEELRGTIKLHKMMPFDIRVQIFFQTQAPKLRYTSKVKHTHLHKDFFFKQQLGKTHKIKNS